MRVVFIQKFVPHYRLPFFEAVRDSLAQQNIDFVLLYSDPDPYEASKVRSVQPPWGTPLKTRHVLIAGRYLYWTNAYRYLKRGDLVVVEHAAKLLDNYLIFGARQLGFVKMAYFGHGENFQPTTEYRISAILKKWMLNVDRWFAYTEVSRQSLLRQCVKDARITVVNNTLKNAANAHLGDSVGKPNTFAYVGGLYELKLLPLLIEACDVVALKNPLFELHIIGDGPQKPDMLHAAESRSWLHVHGSLYGLDRDTVLAQSTAILMPGLVGLIAIDSFQFKRPIITSDAGEHSPEIAYLEHETNCLIDKAPVSAKSYASLIQRYISDIDLQTKLVEGCLKSSKLFSIENMAANFCKAIYK